MYCPKCGQQQLSDEMRFCSRCGFQLGALTALIANNGLPPVPVIANAGKKQGLQRPGVRQGAKLIFLSTVLFIVAVALSIVFDSPLPFFVPATVFTVGLLRMIYAVLFGDDASQSQPHSAPSLRDAAQQSLPQGQGTPVSDWKRSPAGTAEMVRPPSVTENTTRLLDDQ
jgi:hypothetical protein